MLYLPQEPDRLQQEQAILPAGMDLCTQWQHTDPDSFVGR